MHQQQEHHKRGQSTEGSNRGIDLALTTLTIAADWRWQTICKHINDHYPCSVHKLLKGKKVFKYQKQDDHLISDIRQKALSKPQGNTETVLQQPPWFTDEIRELWTKKRRAQKAATRHKNDDDDFKNQAWEAAIVFEKAAKESKKKLYDDFAKAVSDDKSLFKLWKLHSSMNRAKKHADILDFRCEDDVWVLTEAEKGKRCLKDIPFKRIREMPPQGKNFWIASTYYSILVCTSRLNVFRVLCDMLQSQS